MNGISKKINALWIILIALLLISCSTTGRLYKASLEHYNKGNYETALETGKQILELKPKDKKAQELIQKSYLQLIEETQTRINLIEAKAPPDMWDQLVREYTLMIEYQNKIKSINFSRLSKEEKAFLTSIQDYTARLAICKYQAARVHFQNGQQLMHSSNDPDIQWEAAQEFKIAMEFVPDYPDASNLYAIARQNSIKRILIKEFEDKSGTPKSYGCVGEILSSTIISKLVQDSLACQFVNIINTEYINNSINADQEMKNLPGDSLADIHYTAKSNNLPTCHNIIEGKILQINYIPPQTTSVELKDSPNSSLQKSGSSKKKNKNKTSETECIYQKFIKNSSLKIITTYYIINTENGIVEFTDSATGYYAWQDEWGKLLSGNEQNLTDTTHTLIQKPEPIPPSELDMLNFAIAELSNEIALKIKDYFVK
ncbi:MAG TPA: hypothetical protein PKH17_00920 [Candidatus Syntrophosphaera sp.]|nr:hypothetical protein [Candidatus Syntrophosphaera sp.]